VCGSFWGLNKFKMAAVAMVTNVQFFLIQTVQRILLILDTKIDHHSKLCFLFLKFSKWPPIKKFTKSLKIKKGTDFNGNGYLQGVRHAAPYGDHFDLLWWPF
jgi:hypothetical protein